MTILRGPDRYLAVMTLIVWGCAAGVATAQGPDQQPTTTNLVDVKARVPVGDVVYVTNNAGITIKGRLAAVTADAVEVFERAGTSRVAVTDIRRIQWRQPDSPLTGVLIGGAIGAAPGLYWLAADPNECTGMCPEEYGFIGIGAAVGGLIDYVIKKRVTVYTADGGSGRATNVTIGPVVTRARKGAQITVKF